MNRRDFLLGRFGRAAGPEPQAAPAPPALPSGAAPALPAVISWLDDSVQELASEAARPFVARRTSLPMLRPPGAVAEEDFLAGCTRCGACATACPHGAVQLLGPAWGAAAGTPVIDAAVAPCLLCDGLPCATACEAAVLDAEHGGRMGTARIQPLDCLGHTGCTVCIERCPVPGAITHGGRTPVVNEALCTGCGSCHHACPAPQNAVLLLPERDRPPRRRAT